MTKWTGIFLFTILTTLLMARPTRPELDLTLQDEIAGYKYQFKEKIRKARLLLRSEKMDRAFSLVLNEVLRERIREDRTFDAVLQSLGRSRENIRVEPESDEDRLFQYSRALKEQADLFYVLVKTAHHDQVREFNQVCQQMLTHLNLMDQMEKELTTKGMLLNERKASSNAGRSDELPISSPGLLNKQGS